MHTRTNAICTWHTQFERGSEYIREVVPKELHEVVAALMEELTTLGFLGFAFFMATRSIDGDMSLLQKVCMHECVCTYVFMRARIGARVCICMYSYDCQQVCIHLHMNAQILIDDTMWCDVMYPIQCYYQCHLCVCVCVTTTKDTHKGMSMSRHVMYVCMYACMYVCIYDTDDRMAESSMNVHVNMSIYVCNV